MPVLQREGVQIWRRRTPRSALLIWFGWLIGAAIFLYCWQRISDATTWFFVQDAPSIAADIWARATPPKWSYITQLGKPIWDTLNIATLGTLIALVLAVPVAFLAARNTTPSALFIRPLALLLIVATRSINSLIWALLLIAIIGPGVLAGVIAIAIRSIGFCAKLLYEAIEEIDRTQVEAITATGASRWQVMAYGIVPQILPAFAGIAVFRWDINIRESTVLGLVGAGGIGMALDSALNLFQWDRVAVILIAIFAVVVLAEIVVTQLRKRVI